MTLPARDITATYDGRSLVGEPIPRGPRLRSLPTVAGQLKKDTKAFDIMCSTAPRKPPPLPSPDLQPSQSGRHALQRDIRVGAVSKVRDGGLWAAQ